MSGDALQAAVNAETIDRFEEAANSVSAEGAEAAAEIACRDKFPGADDERVSDLRQPEAELIAAWTRALGPVAAAGGSYTSYEECMQKSGVLARLGNSTSVEDAQAWLYRDLEDGVVPLGAERHSGEWQALEEADSANAAADWNCRKDIRARLGDEVAVAVAGFEADNRSAIERARRAWDSTVERAIALGWEPQSP